METKKNKILIVDDEARNQRIVLETLEGLGDIAIASSGEEALELIESFMPDVVLLDIMMPGIDGYEVSSKIRSNPHFLLTKIILVSGKAMIDERLQGYASGADDYITKPFIPDELLAKVRVFLRLSQVENEIVRLNSLLEDRVKNKTTQLMEVEEKLVSSFTSHDIYTPLNNIRVLAKHLSDIANTSPFDSVLACEKTKLIDKALDRIDLIMGSDQKVS